MELDSLLHELVIAIDVKIKEVEEDAKKSSTYKSYKQYRACDKQYLEILLTKRNTIVEIINYIRSGDIKALEEIDYRKKRWKL